MGSFGSKQYRVKVHQPLARALLEGCLDRNFDIAFCHKAFMGHAFVVPFEHILEERQIPIVPLFVNVYVPPLPQPHRAYQLGRAIREIVSGRDERIAILASGGMSHYPGTEKYGHPDFAFDRYLLQVIERGELSSLLNLSAQQLDETGETELLTWYTLFGAVGDQRGEVLSYQPTWHHGLGVINFPLAVPLEGPPLQAPLPQAIETSNAGYRYYKFPEPESYNLNRMLYALRMRSEDRRRFVRDMDAMFAKYKLRPEEMAAVKTLDPLKVAAVGAHPILAWTAVHLVAAAMRAQELKSGSSKSFSDA